MTEPEQVQVTQADRDVAEQLWLTTCEKAEAARLIARHRHRHTVTADALELMREARGTIERLERNMMLVIQGKPVRDVCETRGEAESTIARLTAAITKIEGTET